jgi:hypothetical protein
MSLTAFGLNTDEACRAWLGTPSIDKVDRLLLNQPDIAREVSGVLTAAYDEAKALLQENLGALIRLADHLSANETLTGPEIQAAVFGTPMAGSGSRESRSGS